MDNKDTFLTVSYKHGFIHTCHNCTTKKVEIVSQIGYERKNHKTVTGAKRYITADYARNFTR